MAGNSQAFLFIPDITGFTSFVGATEIEHSQHIITELLELIINADQLGLVVSEIEGDAVFSYRRDSIPSVNAIVEQCEKTFIRFHNHLRRYESERICRCGACETAVNLSLKFVAHQGPVESIKIRDHEKLHGMDVILAHRLLKNSIPHGEYILLTNKLEPSGLSSQLADKSWFHLESGTDTYDGIGDVGYSFISLAPLHQDVSDPDPITIPGLGPDKLSLSETIHAPVGRIYENFTDFNKRVQWNEEIREIILRNEQINKAGALHTCLVGSQSLDIESIGRVESGDRIIYGERLGHFRGLQDILTIYTFDRRKDETVITVDLDFKPRSVLSKILRPVIKAMFLKQTRKGLKKLKQISEMG
jgi:hypothetical protein